MHAFTHGLSGGSQMLGQGVHQLIEVFLEHQGDFNKRHVQLFDQIHRTLR
jgi:hypothetical protein